MKNENDDAYDSDPQSLTHMMSLDADEKLWAPEELGAILEHQLSAPLQCDLGRLDDRLPERLKELNSAGDEPVKTFGDLLHHGRPPLELLKLTKRFAKACRNHPDGPLPGEVATVLYFSSIVAAMIKCGRRITRMDDRSLQYSLQWALRQPWLDDATRRMLQEGLIAVGRSEPDPR